MTTGELDSPEESHRSETRHIKEGIFVGSNMKSAKCSVGTMDGAKANVCDSIT